MSASEAKCNACHGTLDYIKGTRHGTYTFDQCMDCHNNSYYGSYHAPPSTIQVIWMPMAILYLLKYPSSCMPTGI